ncbi:hypothetical protein C368_03176 [Cryptococcus neoformans 125.91]|nr:hypothetical protein C368_03176 [Cryptococcus neoformans var. grubii 125.91]OWZ78632.1 hypothetical protein C365_02830 [Cryptococcus neoformans var. grubii Bt85]OXM79155.1 hypothetical protein C364_02646 [Cryptococcus neoformans var. grubii Bt63]
MFHNAFIFDQPPQPQAHPLLQPNHTICPAYHHPNRLDHEERYLGWHPHHHARHNGIVALLRSTLQALINGIVTLKPRTQEGQHRNDPSQSPVHPVFSSSGPFYTRSTLEMTKGLNSPPEARSGAALVILSAWCCSDLRHCRKAES